MTARKTIRVAISGKSGCGNSTVSGLLAGRLGVPLINYTFHTLADELGISLAEVLERARDNSRYDTEVDTKQVELARKGSCVLGSRLAIWLLGDADLKVYLDAAILVRAQRIQKREGGSLEEIIDFTKNRDEQDHERYRKLYGIDNDSYGFADIVIDVEKKTPDGIVDLIMAALASRKLNG
jgi:CMP/dCMP kinase